MKLIENHFASLSQLITQRLLKSSDIQKLKTEKEIFDKVYELLKEEAQKLENFEKEVYVMLDHLEETHQGQFERGKMYPLLKKELAKKKGIVL